MSNEASASTINRLRIATLIGIVACLAIVTGVVVPYVVVPPGGTAAYYAVTPIGPPVVAVFAGFVILLFVLGTFSQFDTSTVSGAILGTSLVTLVIAFYWAVSVPAGFVMELSRIEELAYHRWLIIVLATLPLIVGLWYTRICLRSLETATRTVGGQRQR